MKLKMNRDQCEAIHRITDMALKIAPVGLEEKLPHLHVRRIFEKLRTKVECLHGKSYSVTLSDEQAIAWRLFWYKHALSSQWLYEANILTQQLQLIEKNYA
jgi:hypothetical protein